MPTPKSDDGLTDKQRRWVEEYCVDFNATQAALRAGYRSTNARQQGTENLAKPVLQAAVAERMAALREKAGVPRERIIKEWARLGFVDIRDAIMWRPNVTHVGEDPDTGEPTLRAFNEVEVRASHDLSPDTAAAIKSVSLSANGQLKLELHDKKGALDSLAKAAGLFIDKKQMVGKDGQPIEPAELNEIELARRIAFLLRRGKERLNGDGRGEEPEMGAEPRPSD